METLRWGILGTAKIARTTVIAAMQQSEHCELVAIASRDAQRAQECADEFGIPDAYGSYEALLANDDIDAVYIPLPHHMHVQWIERAVLAGKHVLCEKPLALRSEDILHLMDLSKQTGKLIGEAYVVLHQERLQGLKDLLDSGEVGKLCAVDGCFFMNNPDAENFRNKYTEGGGGLWDIGVYPIVCGMWMFGSDPVAVACDMTLDERFGVDTLSSGLLRFPNGGQMTFGCGTAHPQHTNMTLFTNSHRIEVQSPYSTDPALKSEFEVYDGNVLSSTRIYSFLPSDQYAMELDHFCESILEGIPYAGDLRHSLRVTRIIEALFRSAKSGRWEEVASHGHHLP